MVYDQGVSMACPTRKVLICSESLPAIAVQEMFSMDKASDLFANQEYDTQHSAQLQKVRTQALENFGHYMDTCEDPQRPLLPFYVKWLDRRLLNIKFPQYSAIVNETHERMMEETNRDL